MESCQLDVVKRINSLRFIFNIKISDFKHKKYVEYVTPFYKFKAENTILAFKFTIVQEDLELKKFPEMCLLLDSQVKSTEEFSFQVISSVLTKPELGLIGFQSPYSQNELKYPNFFHYDDLLKAGDINGIIKLSFDISRINESDDQNADCLVVERTESAVNEFLKILPFLKNGIFSDVLIKCHNEEYKAHKIILSTRSTYFSRLFTVESKEKSDIVFIPDEFKPEAVEEMLVYMYSNITTNLPSIPMDLFRVSHQYGIDDLEKLCKNHILANINADNVTRILKMAEKYDLKDMITKCQHYIRSFEHLVIKNDDYIKYITDSMTVSNIADILCLVDKYENFDLLRVAMEFIAKNFKDVMRDPNYRNLYNTSKVRFIMEIDEYLATHLQVNEKN